MTKLFKLLGEEKYNKLKEILGDAFSKLESDYENDSISIDDVNAELDKAGLEKVVSEAQNSDTTTDTTETTKTTETTETTDTSETGDTSETATVDTSETDTVDTSKAGTVLEDGWLIDGKIDYDKIKDESLVAYIKGLQKIAQDADWYAEYKIAVLREALISGMNDVDDALVYITMDKISSDVDGKIVGVKEAFVDLKKSKPYLFKAEDTTSTPVKQGFNPVGKVISKPTSYAEAVRMTNEMSN